jgi:hypothetical protein
MAFLIAEGLPVFPAASLRHFSSLLLWLLCVFTPISSMAKGKKAKSKKITTKLPPIQPERRCDNANELDEPLKFLESPLPTVEGSERTGHLSKVQWPADDAGDRLNEDDDLEVDVEELELESDEV